MKAKRILGLMWGIGLASIAASAPADDIKAIHGAFSKAMRAGKPEGAEKLISLHMTPDFAAIMANGMRTNRAGYAAQVKAQLKTTKFTQYDFTYGPIGPSPGGLGLTSTLRFTATMKDPKGKVHKQVGTIVCDEVWILIGKTPKWRRMRVQSTSISTDGKPPVKTGGGPRVRLGVA